MTGEKKETTRVLRSSGKGLNLWRLLNTKKD